jgi:choline kinase
VKAIIILAAGRPHIENNPTIICKIFEKNSIFNFIKSSFKFYTNEIILVSGFGNAKVKKNIKNIKKLKHIFNNNWKKTGSCGSLLKCDLKKYDEIIVLYSDIIFDQNLCDILIKSKNQITFFHSQFYKDQILLKENFYLKKKNITQFVGVVKFKKKAIDLILKLKDIKNGDIEKLNILQLVNLLKKNKISDVKKIDIKLSV